MSIDNAYLRRGRYLCSNGRRARLAAARSLAVRSRPVRLPQREPDYADYHALKNRGPIAHQGVDDDRPEARPLLLPPAPSARRLRSTPRPVPRPELRSSLHVHNAHTCDQLPQDRGTHAPNLLGGSQRRVQGWVGGV